MRIERRKGRKEGGQNVSVFHCPVCGEKVGAFRKYLQFLKGKNIIECSSCKTQLLPKKYGTSVTTANLIVMCSYWILGSTKRVLPLIILLWLIITFIQKAFAPLVPYEPKNRTRLQERLLVALGTIAVAAYIVLGIFYT